MPMSDNRKQTVIDDGTKFEGSIRSDCDVTIRGTLEGQVSAPSVTVSSSGAMHGRATVEHLTAEGEVSGKINAGKVVLSGRVNDQTVISAETLEVLSNSDEGVQVSFGNCELRVGGENPRGNRQAEGHENASKSVTSYET
jgi:cytoskeletal protein CcmA (bactofilin family)